MYIYKSFSWKLIVNCLISEIKVVIKSGVDQFGFWELQFNHLIPSVGQEIKQYPLNSTWQVFHTPLRIKRLYIYFLNLSNLAEWNTWKKNIILEVSFNNVKEQNIDTLALSITIIIKWNFDP